MNEFIARLRILARAEMTLFKADAQRRTQMALLSAISIGCIFVALVFVNIGFFFMLTDSDVDSRAAFILAGANFALAVIPYVLQRQAQPGPEEQMVREIRDMAADQVVKDVNGVTAEISGVADEIAEVGSGLKQLKAGVSSFGGGGMASIGALGSVVPVLIEFFKKSRK